MLDLDLCLSAVYCGVMTTTTSILVAGLLSWGLIISQSILTLNNLFFIYLSLSVKHILLVQNLFTQLSDTTVLFYLYLKLQNLDRHETSWVSSRILWTNF
jgi:hypothetical protein